MKANRLSLQECQNKMQNISASYLALRRILNKGITLSDDNFSFVCAYIQKVEKTFNSLEKREQQILNNEFFYQDISSNWKKQYSLKQYQQLIYQAAIHFLEEFYVSYQ